MGQEDGLEGRALATRVWVPALRSTEVRQSWIYSAICKLSTSSRSPQKKKETFYFLTKYTNPVKQLWPWKIHWKFYLHFIFTWNLTLSRSVVFPKYNRSFISFLIQQTSVNCLLGDGPGSECWDHKSKEWVLSLVPCKSLEPSTRKKCRYKN